MTVQTVKTSTLILVLSFMASPVFAHTGIGSTHSFADGALHPLQGIDHLLVMLAVGIWSSSHNSKFVWQLPANFLLAMIAGAAIQVAGLSIPGAEQAVIFSVLAFGVIVGFSWRMSSVWTAGIVSVFAFFHGYVHAAESMAGNSQLAYLSGCLMASAGLIGLGMATGLLGAKIHKLLRLSYGIIASAAGIALLMA
jgi:urease accessory protein